MGLNTKFVSEGATKPHSIAVDTYDQLMSAVRSMPIASDQQELVDLSNLASTGIIYVGTAASGVSQSFGADNNANVPNWMIQQITIVSGISVQTLIGWGPWNDRAALTYQ